MLRKLHKKNQSFEIKIMSQLLVIKLRRLYYYTRILKITSTLVEAEIRTCIG